MLCTMVLDEGFRKKLQQPYELYFQTYTDRISPVFDNIDQEAEEVAKDVYDKIMMNVGYEDCDPSDFADDAWEFGIDYYENVSLMRYNTQLMWISTMYQFWEQQVRKFLYKEMTRSGYQYLDKNQKEVEYKDFCTNINKIKTFFLEFKVDVTTLASWDKINELRLLANVIKHGPGGSAEDLLKIRPDLFDVSHVSTNLLDLYQTTLNDVVINLKDNDFETYANSLSDFWEQLPDTMVTN
ncbi:hypothetical protein COD68_24875 [Bacillus cereus]|uniref:hypothetical protein n=1 Tax=Bacillus cereus TaxID=1396 RepID=UPI000BFC7A5F|nr:hypothetical protein [Bacillus cereus]PGU80054.1 hypothetical protein COD68_24875 [Bacillus cereus]